MSNQKCSYIKDNCEKCQGFAVSGSQFCFSHDPKLRAEKIEACIKGGKYKRQSEYPLPPINLGVGEIPNIIESTINAIRSGEQTAKDASVVNQLLDTYLKIFRQ